MKRKAFLTSAAVVAASPAAVAASGVPGGTRYVERASDFDRVAFREAVGRPADIRQLFEAISFHPQLLNNVKNSLNGLQFGFGYNPNRIAIIVAPHGPSTAYTYSNAMWSKYRIGEALNLRDQAGSSVLSNIFLKQKSSLDPAAGPDDENSVLQDTSIETLQTRGVLFLTCHTSVEEQARAFVKGGFAPPNAGATDVANDLLTHLIADTLVVPSMVAAIGVLQHSYGFTYATMTFA